MKFKFSGAAGSVTGSSHLIEVGDRQVLLDCGLYQGSDARERGNEEFPFDPAKIDFLILSHAHIDHSGRVPMLYKHGFRGKIISTGPTYELSDIMLRDSAFIQEQDAERENRHRRRGRKPLEEPIYSIRDAEGVLKLFQTVDYEQEFELFPGFRLRFQDSGHMLGSAFVEMWIRDDFGEEIKVVFSGDIGNHNIPLMREPHYVREADVVIMESTYGDRLHEPQTNENQRLIDLINMTIRRGGNVIIPSFAVGRTQEILYVLNEYAEAGGLDKRTRVYVDSPLAGKATAVFARNTRYFDKQAQARMAAGDNVLEFPQLDFTESVEDSMKLNRTREGLVVISASGMAEAGRIRHHLKHNLWRPESTVIFVGYQAEGTTGRQILDGKKEVRIFGEDIAVEAQIEQLHGLSGHADQAGLLEFVDAFTEGPPRRIFLVHGDEEARAVLAGKLRERGFNVELPMEGTIVECCTRDDLERLEKTTIVPPEHGRPAQHLREQLIEGLRGMDVDAMDDEQILRELRQLLRQRR